MFCELWRQFWLLTVKNLILVKRSKLWTFFEIVLPILFTLPIIIALMKLASVSISPSISFKEVEVFGNSSDVLNQVSFLNTIASRWCSKDKVKLAYYTKEALADVDALMQEIAKRYRSHPQVEVLPQNFASYGDLLIALKGDAPNNTNYGCSIKDYVGGIAFDSFNLSTRTLKYQIILPAKVSFMELQWNLDRHWNDPYGPNHDFSRLPADPPYWTSGFLSFQHAIDSTFIQSVSPSSSPVDEDPSVSFLRLPEPEYLVNSVAAFVIFLPLIWGMCSFLTVIHAAREVAHEKHTVKTFLSVMGLSTPMFYGSHAFFAWIKCCIVFLACAIPLSTIMTHISVSLFLVSVLLYGLGAVMLGVLIASIFNTPNSALKVTIVVWVVLVGVVYWKTPRTEEIGACFLFSLNINGAFFMVVQAMNDYMNRDTDLSWWNVFEGGSFHFTAGFSLVMMVVDILWMAALTLFFDCLLGNTDFNLRTLFYSTRGYGDDVVDGGLDETDGGRHEVDSGQRSVRPGIEVTGLVKVWGETGERAVDGLTLKAYPGQVTVLLGHNGAGKSTTFSIICGIVKATAGHVEICGHRVHSSSCKNVGLCPQGNALFDKLTVKEHLWFINGLKGTGREYMEEGRYLLDQLKLNDKDNELSMNLSGGMKRKLCVCLALIGGSKVVLLDEPTAGMDPGARRDVEKLLEMEKKDRAVLLTTHYMDEAELLGDRVAIMVKGKAFCSGTPQYLKNEFASEYLLTLVLSDVSSDNGDNKVNDLLGKEQQFVPKATLGEVHGRQVEVKHLLDKAQQFVPMVTLGEVHGRQVEIVLPKDKQDEFPQLFEYLEKHQGPLNIQSFGLSLNTLEQVFLKVGDMSDKADTAHSPHPHMVNSSSVDRIDSNDSAHELISSQTEGKKSGVALVLSQLRAVFTKRFLYSLRNWPQLITQVVVPLAILALVAYLSKLSLGGGVDSARNLTEASFGPSRVLYRSKSPSVAAAAYKNMIESWDGAKLVNIPSDNFTSFAANLPKDLPAIGLGALFDNESIKVIFNSRAMHSLPTSLNLVNNARLRASAAGHTPGGIGVSIYTYAPAKHDDTILVPSGVVDNVLGPLLVLALALLTSTFVMFLVEERSCKFAHQQSLTGISPFVFWGASFLFDFIFYALACTVFIIVFIISKWMQGYILLVLLMWLLYFWACVPFVYSVSFMFSSPSKANVLLVIWQIVAAFAAMLILFIVSTIPGLGVDKTFLEFVRSLLLFILPSFALGNGLMTLGSFSSSSTADKSTIWEWDNLGKNLAFMTLFGCLSSMLFVMFQFKQIRRLWFNLWDYKFNGYNKVAIDDNEDEDVKQEREKVARWSSNSTETSLALEVKDLTKLFGRVRAVDDLTLGIQDSECFGLLGVNGAGKTTTFDILTGQSFPTSGTARIKAHDVTEHIAIGYCPQFDAMMMDLTGKETLMILARMYGFRDPERKADVILRAVGMTEHANKLVRFYSGGQRRKVSVGLSLLSATHIVILDEPTAGIDPKARREIWEVLSAVRDNSSSALLLTSHSMDECEALCSRIAVLSKGRMIAIGTSQALKSKFGNSYTLSMVANSSAVKTTVMEAVKKQFPDSTLKTHAESFALTLKWQIPKSPSDRWSSMFSTCQSLARSLPVSDFCLAQSSLEETFLRLAGHDTEDDASSIAADRSISHSQHHSLPV